jgi:hypothetical protein
MAFTPRFSTPRQAFGSGGSKERQAQREQEWRDRNAETQREYLADIAMDGTDGEDD